MNNVETIKKNMGDLYAESKGDSFEHTSRDGKNWRLNALEYYVANATEEHGIPEVGEELIKAMGSGEENPFDESILYTPTGFGKMSNVLGAVNTIATTGGTAATGTTAATTGMFGAASGAISSVAGPLAIAAMVGDMWKGANDVAAANRKKMKELGDGLKSLNKKRTQMGADAREDIANIWEGIGNKLQDVRGGIGDKLDNMSNTVQSVIKKGKGLATGDSDQIISNATTSAQENLASTTDSLERDASLQVDAYGKRLENETEEMSIAALDMERQVADLSKKQFGYQNIL